MLRVYVVLGVVAAIVVGDVGIYIKGRSDGRNAYKTKITREINDAVNKGDSAREKALRDFDALPDGSDSGGVPDDGFRRS